MEHYAFHLDFVRNNLTPSARQDLEKAMEFQAIQAFLLGMRTGGAGGQPSIKAATRPKVRGPQTAVTSMVAP